MGRSIESSEVSPPPGAPNRPGSYRSTVARPVHRQPLVGQRYRAAAADAEQRPGAARPDQTDPTTVEARVDNAGEEVLALVSTRDQSECVDLADLEMWVEQLERSNRDLSEFAYVAAHDLRAPLAALAGSAELLARRSGSELSEEGQRYLGAILGRVGTMGRMIDDILSYCQPEDGGEDCEVVECSKILDEVLEHLAAEIADADAQVRVQPMGTVAGRRIQLVRLFQNLISNALKFPKPSGALVVDVSVRRIGDEQVFAVSDTGIGVSEENRANMFDMFERLNQQGSSTGTGIGLAICKRIVERHGGSIWADNSPSGGLCVSFSLPAPPPVA
jgi:signal transduction histidine kinase